MESEKLKKNSVRLDWRNWCELKVLHIYVLIWMLVLRLCSGGRKRYGNSGGGEEETLLKGVWRHYSCLSHP